MRWTDMGEKEMIKAWAAEEYAEGVKEGYLPQPDASKESYWTDFDNGGNIAEYDFSSVPELLALLKLELTEGYQKRFTESYCRRVLAKKSQRLIPPAVTAERKEKQDDSIKC